MGFVVLPRRWVVELTFAFGIGAGTSARTENHHRIVRGIDGRLIHQANDGPNRKLALWVRLENACGDRASNGPVDMPVARVQNDSIRRQNMTFSSTMACLGLNT
jgi:hypothetical protein